MRFVDIRNRGGVRVVVFKELSFPPAHGVRVAERVIGVEKRAAGVCAQGARSRERFTIPVALVSHSDELRLMARTALNTIQVLDRLYPANEAVAAANVKTARHPPW